VAKQEFGRAALFIEGDDSQLRATLQRDEALTRTSAAKMQANLQPLTIGVTELGASADVAASSVGVLSSVAAATGSAAIATAAQIGAIGTSLKGLGNQALGASAQLKALASASIAFLGTGLGLALAALAAVVGVVALAWRSHNKELAEANRLAEEGKKKFEEQSASIDKQNQALLKRLELARGGNAIDIEAAAIRKRAAETDDPFLRGGLRFGLTILRQIQDAERAKKLRAEEAAANVEKQVAIKAQLQIQENARQATFDRVSALDREISILDGSRTAYSFIVDEIERARTITRDRLAAEKEINDAFAARVGPQTAGDASRLIANELKVLQARKESSRVLGTTLRQMLAIGKITQDQFETLQKTFGLEKARISFGPAALQTFKQVSLSRTALGGPGSQPVPVQKVHDAAAVKGLKRVENAVNKNRVLRAG
jgi:hypothetical protein